MQKPVCPKCARYYRPERNGVPYIEMMPIGGEEDAPVGNQAPEFWQPYKLWLGDKWKCDGCGHEIIVGAGQRPVSEHYHKDFSAIVESYKVEIKVNDC